MNILLYIGYIAKVTIKILNLLKNRNHTVKSPSMNDFLIFSFLLQKLHLSVWSRFVKVDLKYIFAFFQESVRKIEKRNLSS